MSILFPKYPKEIPRIRSEWQKNSNVGRDDPGTQFWFLCFAQFRKTGGGGTPLLQQTQAKFRIVILKRNGRSKPLPYIRYQWKSTFANVIWRCRRHRRIPQKHKRFLAFARNDKDGAVRKIVGWQSSQKNSPLRHLRCHLSPQGEAFVRCIPKNQSTAKALLPGELSAKLTERFL